MMGYPPFTQSQGMPGSQDMQFPPVGVMPGSQGSTIMGYPSQVTGAGYTFPPPAGFSPGALPPPPPPPETAGQHDTPKPAWNNDQQLHMQQWLFEQTELYNRAQIEHQRAVQAEQQRQSQAEAFRIAQLEQFRNDWHRDLSHHPGSQ